jgi:hypothetical protein
MKFLKSTFLPIFAATVWISISEFIRNQFLLNRLWTGHYASLGLTFPSEPVNGAMWGVWSLLYAILIFIISRKFGLLHTTLISWFAGFVLMWVILWNMNVFPVSILWYAVPLSLLEAFLASLIIIWLRKKSTKSK